MKSFALWNRPSVFVRFSGSTTKARVSIKLILTFLVAAAGMTSELALAYLYSIAFGGTVLQYVITVGLFTFSMGVGALLFRAEGWNAKRLFVYIQFALLGITILAGSVLSLIAINPALTEFFGLFLYGPALLIGFLSGIELPLLMLGEEEPTQSRIIAIDYLGMFTATLIFPLALLPMGGVPLALCFAALLNLLALVLTWFSWDPQ
jgi:spermidine synthase